METEEQRAAKFAAMWEWYFKLLDSGWRPDDSKDTQADYDTERREGWAYHD